MSQPLSLLIHGATGRMGQAVARLVCEFDSLRLVAAVGGRTAPRIGAVPGFEAGRLREVPDFDVCIDFSLAPGFDAIVDLCQARGAALVSGTTGLEAQQVAHLDAVSTAIPVLWAANFSLGVALLEDLVQRAARALPGWQCDIVESHHLHKRDAPSGTALMLGQAVEAAGAPPPHYASLRAGDIIGEHLVQFTGLGERIELLHRAGNRDIFARGALHCACALPRRAAGRYRVLDLIAAAVAG